MKIFFINPALKMPVEKAWVSRKVDWYKLMKFMSFSYSERRTSKWFHLRLTSNIVKRKLRDKRNPVLVCFYIWIDSIYYSCIVIGLQPNLLSNTEWLPIGDIQMGVSSVKIPF